MNNSINNNPLFNKDYGTPHNTPPFDRVRFEHFEPAIMEAIKRDNDFIQRIVNNPDTPTFDNTIGITTPDDMLERVTKILFNLLSANTDDKLDELAQKLSPILTQHANDIIFNKPYFERVKYVYDLYNNENDKAQHQQRQLSDEETMLLRRAYEGFRRAGVELPQQKQDKLREINSQLSILTLQFSQNLLKETKAFELRIKDPKDIEGLTPTAIEAAANAAKEKGFDGWIITLNAPSYGPFMTYADNRELRKQLYLAKNTLCCHGDQTDNREILRQIVNLRLEKAQLLGFKTYSDYVLVERMAEKPQKVYQLIDKLLNAYIEPARHEVQEIENFAHSIKGDDFKLQPWDFSYFAQKLRKQLFDIDSEMLRPYFELSKVRDGIFNLATRLYGITFRYNADIPVYHRDVEAYEVFDADGSYLAVLYTDFYPRDGKQSGAWMTSFKEQWMGRDENDEPTAPLKNSRPHVSLVMNFTKPTYTKPALLSLAEVETFLHEFGHALHGIFSNTHFASLSGTNVYWDFVELPSQLMENFAIQPEFLDTFAQNYQTGQPLPKEYIDRIIASRNFNVAYACVRQLSFSLLDMAYYSLNEPLLTDITEFEHQAWQQAILLSEVDGACMSTQFSHIFSGGYAAGYYSYKWAEVLDADAFAQFKKAGIFDRATAQRFRDEILSKGGTEEPMTLYRRFRKGEPTIQALLERNGIIKDKQQ